ncbi:MAG: hypothetical protein WAM70_00040 [Pyrinomonadaceae bacterium]
MARKTLSVLLALSLGCGTSRLVLAQTSAPPKPAPTTTNANPKQGKFAEQVKAHIVTLGTGPGARIELRLRDRTKVKGYVNFIEEDYFVVADDQTGMTTRMTYAQVIQIKGKDLNRDKELAIGIVLGLLILYGAGSLTGGP